MKEYTIEQLKALERDTWSERYFQTEVMVQLRGRGWTAVHFKPGYTGLKWKEGSQAGQDMIVTTFDGDKGFPDTVAIHRPTKRGLAWELKSKNGKPSQWQLYWLACFEAVGFDARVAYPGDWDELMAYLEGRE